MIEAAMIVFCLLAAFGLFIQVFVLNVEPENNYGQGAIICFVCVMIAVMIWIMQVLYNHFVT